MTTLADIGELKAIERICALLPAGSDVIVGPGDDCAVVRSRPDADIDWVLTSDPVICNTHFTPDAPPTGIGHKAVGRILSDIAAMAAAPRWCLLNVAAPVGTPVTVLEEIYSGATPLASKHGLCTVGGDISQSANLEIHAFGVGAVPAGAAVLRSGARPGDLLFVTGSLGCSSAGRHLSFEPRVREGAWLRDWATSMIDVSDGLAADAAHVAAMSRVDCELESAAVPLSDAARAAPDDITPLDHALRDGEDFELLFTVPGERSEEFTSAWVSAFDLQCTRIGRVIEGTGRALCVSADGTVRALNGAGYAHFG